MWELDCFNARDFRQDPAYLAMFGDRASNWTAHPAMFRMRWIRSTVGTRPAYGCTSQTWAGRLSTPAPRSVGCS